MEWIWGGHEPKEIVRVLCGSGAVLYLDCGGGHQNLCVGSDYIELYVCVHTQMNAG